MHFPGVITLLSPSRIRAVEERVDRKLLEVTVCKPECAQLIRIDSCTRSSTRRLSDKTRGGGSEGGREGKGHVSYAALFLPLPLSLRRLEFGARTSGGTRASLKYGLRAPPPILSWPRSIWIRSLWAILY